MKGTYGGNGNRVVQPASHRGGGAGGGAGSRGRGRGYPFAAAPNTPMAPFRGGVPKTMPTYGDEGGFEMGLYAQQLKPNTSHAFAASGNSPARQYSAGPSYVNIPGSYVGYGGGSAAGMGAGADGELPIDYDGTGAAAMSAGGVLSSLHLARHTMGATKAPRPFSAADLQNVLLVSQAVQEAPEDPTRVVGDQPVSTHGMMVRGYVVDSVPNEKFPEKWRFVVSVQKYQEVAGFCSTVFVGNHKRVLLTPRQAVAWGETEEYIWDPQHCLGPEEQWFSIPGILSLNVFTNKLRIPKVGEEVALTLSYASSLAKPDSFFLKMHTLTVQREALPMDFICAGMLRVNATLKSFCFPPPSVAEIREAAAKNTYINSRKDGTMTREIQLCGPLQLLGAAIVAPTGAGHASNCQLNNGGFQTTSPPIYTLLAVEAQTAGAKGHSTGGDAQGGQGGGGPAGMGMGADMNDDQNGANAKEDTKKYSVKISTLVTSIVPTRASDKDDAPMVVQCQAGEWQIMVYAGQLHTLFGTTKTKYAAKLLACEPSFTCNLRQQVFMHAAVPVHDAHDAMSSTQHQDQDQASYQNNAQMDDLHLDEQELDSLFATADAAMNEKNALPRADDGANAHTAPTSASGVVTPTPVGNESAAHAVSTTTLATVPPAQSEQSPAALAAWLSGSGPKSGMTTAIVTRPMTGKQIVAARQAGAVPINAASLPYITATAIIADRYSAIVRYPKAILLPGSSPFLRQELRPNIPTSVSWRFGGSTHIAPRNAEAFRNATLPGCAYSLEATSWSPIALDAIVKNTSHLIFAIIPSGCNPFPKGQTKILDASVEFADFLSTALRGEYLAFAIHPTPEDQPFLQAGVYITTPLVSQAVKLPQASPSTKSPTITSPNGGTDANKTAATTDTAPTNDCTDNVSLSNDEAFVTDEMDAREQEPDERTAIEAKATDSEDQGGVFDDSSVLPMDTVMMPIVDANAHSSVDASTSHMAPIDTATQEEVSLQRGADENRDTNAPVSGKRKSSTNRPPKRERTTPLAQNP